MKILATIITAMVMFTTTACGSSPDNSYSGVCVDPGTERRLENDTCDPDDEDFVSVATVWYIVPNSNHQPDVGDEVDSDEVVTSLPADADSYMLDDEDSFGSEEEEESFWGEDEGDDDGSSFKKKRSGFKRK